MRKTSLIILALLTTFLAGFKPIEQANNRNLSDTKISQNSNLANLENAAFQQVNNYRKSRKLPALQLNSNISEQARIHSQNMARGKVAFSHDGFHNRAKIISQKISYQAVAENVAFNMGYSDPVKEAVEGWIKSAGHRHNMEGNYNLTGMGIALNPKGEYYFTQIFMKTR
jgi:uncharacterized protein YkwD